MVVFASWLVPLPLLPRRPPPPHPCFASDRHDSSNLTLANDGKGGRCYPVPSLAPLALRNPRHAVERCASTGAEGAEGGERGEVAHIQRLTMYCFGTTNKQKTAILHQVDWQRVGGFTMRIFGEHGPTAAFSMAPAPAFRR